MFKPLILLGCNGRHKEYVQLCGGTKFPLINLQHLPEEDRKTAENYIYMSMQLSKGKLFDHNQIINIIQFLTTHYLDDNFTSAIYEWVSMHKKCGMYIEGI